MKYIEARKPCDVEERRSCAVIVRAAWGRGRRPWSATVAAGEVTVR